MKKSKIVRNVLAVIAIVFMATLFAGCPQPGGSSTGSKPSGTPSGSGPTPAEKVAGIYSGGGLDYLFKTDGTGSVSSTSLSMRAAQAGDTFTWEVKTSSGNTITVSIIIVGRNETIDATFDTVEKKANIGGVECTKQDSSSDDDDDSDDDDFIIDLTSTPVVGSIIMKDGSLKTKETITGDEANAIAVVYYVDTAKKKAYAVGKNHDAENDMKWCTNAASVDSSAISGLETTVGGTAPNNLTFSKYIDGSTGLATLKAAANDYDAAKYPAWAWCETYGNTAANVPDDAKADFKTGWYFPSVKELYDIFKAKATVDAALTAAGGQDFTGVSYLSSSTDGNGCLRLNLNSGSGYGETAGNTSGYSPKSNGGSDNVCAVRVFTY